MRRLLVVLVLLIGGLAPATVAQADGSGQQTISASGINTLQLSVENGNIVVTAADQGNIVINNALTAGFVPVTFQQNGATLAGDVADPSADVTVQVPLGLTLNLNSSNGNITVTGSQGPLTLTADNGTMTVQGSSSQPVNLQDQNGAIQLSGYSGGGTINASNGDVSLTLPSGAGAQLNLTTANGQLTVSGTAQGADQVTTSVGSGGSLFTIQTSNGNITAQ